MNATVANAVKSVPLFEPIEEGLDAVVDKMRGAARSDMTLIDDALAHVVAVGGKLIRPALAITVANIYRETDPKVISLAASVEMLHTATLVHDDMIDEAAQRRGNPTLHTMLDAKSAVLLGDYLFAQAAAWAAETDSIRVVQIFSDTLMTIVGGELQQMWARFDLARANDDYNARIFGKTAVLFASACEAGAVLGRAPAAEVEALREYGRKVGLAFQIIDDLLDYVGDSARLGKPVGSDLRNGNITLPVILYLRDYDRENLSETLFKDGLDEARIDEVVSRVIDSPALRDTLSAARRLAEESKQSLVGLPALPQVERLRALTDYVVNRTI